MKKSKLLIPLLTVSGAAAIVAPVLTSCTQGEKEETHFKLTTETKKTTLESPTISGQIELVFTTEDEFSKEKAEMIEPVAVITTSNSFITLERCWKESYADKTMKVLIAYTVNPEAYEYKEKDKKKLANEVVKFDLKIHNGTWTQTTKGFSIEAKRADK